MTNTNRYEITVTYNCRIYGPSGSGYADYNGREMYRIMMASSSLTAITDLIQELRSRKVGPGPGLGGEEITEITAINVTYVGRV